MDERVPSAGAHKNIIGIILILAGVGAVLYNWAYKPLVSPKQSTQQEASKPAAPAGSPAKPSATAPAKAPYTSNIQVAVRGFSFTPNELHIKASTKITWANFDDAGHTITSDTGVFTSKILGKNQSFEHIFNKLGTYPYHCVLHPNMKGYIIVE